MRKVITKEEMLENFKKKTAMALDIVTSTIEALTNINFDIETSMVEISEEKAKLQVTEDGLKETKANNEKIINKFKALIED